MTREDALFERLKADIALAPTQGLSSGESLWGILRFVAKWRSDVLGKALLARSGRQVLNGPFAGMDYVAAAAEGSLAARLLGCYEGELHPHIAAFVAEGVDTVVDIGCAEGYYAVGLARLLPHAEVHAFDISAEARIACAALAAANGVQDRVVIGERFAPARFADYGPSTLVIVDIEGGEVDLLDPDAEPALRRLSLIVETHPGARPGATDVLAERFAASHEVIRVDHGLTAATLPPWLANSSHMDVVLAAWEWRATATPWLVMRPRDRSRP